MTRSGFILPPTIALTLLVGISTLDSGCASSDLTNSWRDQSFNGPPLTNVFIIAVKKNAVNRRVWEDGLVAELSARGVTSTPSYRLYPAAIPDTQQVEVAVLEKKCDGVLVVRRLPNATSTYERPGYIRSVPVTRFDRLNKTYYTIYAEVNEPGYADTLKTVRHEVNLWSTKEGGQLIWAGTGEMLDPGSREDVMNEITGLIVPELARQGLIPAK